jgi:hypothetical protein
MHRERGEVEGIQRANGKATCDFRVESSSDVAKHTAEVSGVAIGAKNRTFVRESCAQQRHCCLQNFLRMPPFTDPTSRLRKACADVSGEIDDVRMYNESAVHQRRRPQGEKLSSCGGFQRRSPRTGEFLRRVTGRMLNTGNSAASE